MSQETMEELPYIESESPPGNVGVVSSGSGRSQSKKRRIAGACDLCKRKKIRCNSSKMPDNRCTNCVQYGVECTHKEVGKTLGSAKSYVESLEARLEKMDRLLNKLVPGINVNQEVDRLEAEEEDDPQTLSRNDDDHLERMLSTDLSKLKLSAPLNRFFGQSSSVQLILTALDLKKEYTGKEVDLPKYDHFRRDEFWAIPPWLSNNPECCIDLPAYTYPPQDLMPSLIDAYFEQINYFLPLLHRPTFERGIREDLHISDPMFGATLLQVCALGARYSNDPRVLVDGSAEPRSAGWRWHEQVSPMRKSLFKKTTLYELQMLTLYVLFASSSEMPQGIWAVLGFALRLAQEVGAHRKKNIRGTPSAEDELWKRAFWIILSLDRHLSSESGRPCGLQDEDFDVGPPLDCDDEFWETGFHQPPGKPSTVAFFNTYLRLTDILASAMRLVYSIKRVKSAPDNVPLRSQQQIIAELDSALNNWMDSVPAHLKWNPACGNRLFLKQSATLHATYYSVQVLIHRPFIPSPRNPLQTSFPSLAICTNAARSCCHVLEAFSRLSVLPLAHLQKIVFSAAVILLLNIWSGKRSGYAPNPKREMEDVQRCIQILEACEGRWALAGRLRDILSALAYAGDVPVSDPPATCRPSTSRSKRPREAEDSTLTSTTLSSSSSTSASPSPASPPDEVRSIAGVRRVSKTTTAPPESQVVPTTPNFALPMYSNELARLPIYGQFNFMDSMPSTVTEPNTVPTFPAPSMSSMPTSMEGRPPSFILDPSIFPPTAPSNMAGTVSSCTRMAPYALDAFFRQQQSVGNGEPADSLNYTTNFPTNPTAFPTVTSADLESYMARPGSGCPFGSAPMDLSSVTMPELDQDIIAMWSTAPTTLELDDWSSYISSVGQMTQSTSQSHQNV
ncbi:unnamed protein product [Cyclocybe aegerita]|uniref:Zn(2)-C6 fungal-type domain-containing protein n=1 Tax=Cyclocybe aegerita TaxID=1973307 RepID=A0A8S0XF90_CYCAE|nr:unnamed protein product [Cyclocybe aegerita]